MVDPLPVPEDSQSKVKGLIDVTDCTLADFLRDLTPHRTFDYVSEEE
jgi:hypothetical protein